MGVLYATCVKCGKTFGWFPPPGEEPTLCGRCTDRTNLSKWEQIMAGEIESLKATNAALSKRVAELTQAITEHEQSDLADDDNENFDGQCARNVRLWSVLDKKDK
jgi:hypothetical protein